MRKLLQRWHGLMVIYHHWALGRHCAHLPSDWIEEFFDAETEDAAPMG